jgi:hypothetical protein
MWRKRSRALDMALAEGGVGACRRKWSTPPTPRGARPRARTLRQSWFRGVRTWGGVRRGSGGA